MLKGALPVKVCVNHLFLFSVYSYCKQLGTLHDGRYADNSSSLYNMCQNIYRITAKHTLYRFPLKLMF